MCSTMVGNLYSKIVSLSTLFERQYIVPEYQRPYEWGIDQLDRMIETISSDEEGNAYSFFGSLQFNVKKENEKEIYEIVDGQQRIISFILLASVLLDEEPKYDGKTKKWSFHKFSMEFKNNVKSEILEENRKHLMQRKQSEWSLDNTVKKIVFAEVVTVNETNPETLLSIFSSMNMEGLPLQREDIFKTKASSIFEGDSSRVIDCINKQYEVIHKFNCDSMTCDLSEYNIIDTFRYYIIEKYEKLQNNKSMTKNPVTLLTEEASKAIMQAKKTSINVFEDITKTIIETQRIIDGKNSLDYSENQTIWFARELIGESRYWNLRNIVYYIVYKISVKKGEPSENEVKTALELSERIWQFCSFYRAYYSKVVNEVYTTIIDLIIKQSKLQNPDEFSVILNKRIEGKPELRKALSDTVSKKCFNSNLPRLMVVLSYFDDASKDDKATIEDIKKKLFYRWKYWKNNQSVELESSKTIEIEHIISQYWAKEVKQVSEDTVHSIGNLMYLEQRINRALGDRLGARGENIESYKDDLNEIKMTDIEQHIRYQNSQMSCVKEFIDEFRTNGKEKVLELIKERGNRKKQFIAKLYKKNMFVIDVE